MNTFNNKIKINNETNDLIIPKTVQYLSEVIDTLPLDCLFDKGKVGCGGTTITIKSEENYVICVPFVSMITNKTSQNSNLFGFYKGVTKTSLKEYIKKTSCPKIMVTYDSLDKVMDVIDPKEYKILIDELHLLFTQYSFRKDAVRTVLNNYKSFKNYCFMTATPLDDRFMLEEIKNVPMVKAIWEDTKTVKVQSVRCENGVKAATKDVINSFINGDNDGNVYFFVNSVAFIEEMIVECGLTTKNTRVIYSQNNKAKISLPNSLTTDKPKKINFLTSTVFEGSDIYDKDGRIVIVSDACKTHTLTDISTSFQQIAGRN